MKQVLAILLLLFRLGLCDFSSEDLAVFTCTLMCKEWVIFDLRDLRRENADQTYTVRTTNSTGTLISDFTYQFCQYTLLTEPKTFAYMDQTFVKTDGTASASTRTILTGDNYVADTYFAIIPDGSRFSDGISVTDDSGPTACASGGYYQFVTNVMCDDSISGVGDAVVTDFIFDTSETDGVTTDNPCVVTMNVKHKRGCPLIDAYRFKLFFQNNMWVTGICCVLFGAFMGLFGLRFLRQIAAILAAITVLFLILLLASAFGFLKTILGICLSCAVALVASIISGIVTLYIVWVAIGFLGILGGFFLASLIYELTLMQFDYFHAWGFMVLIVFGVITGLVLSSKYGKEVIVISTSLVGGYFVMRGTSDFFPNRFPTESEIVKSIEAGERQFDMDWRFWIYMSEWVIFMALFMVFQCMRYIHRPITAKETVNTSLN